MKQNVAMIIQSKLVKPLNEIANWNYTTCDRANYGSVFEGEVPNQQYTYAVI